jgi:hypothetical protein
LVVSNIVGWELIAHPTITTPDADLAACLA